MPKTPVSFERFHYWEMLVIIKGVDGLTVS